MGREIAWIEGYGIRAEDNEPVAIIRRSGLRIGDGSSLLGDYYEERVFMDEGQLSRILELSFPMPSEDTYRDALEGLQQRIADGFDFGEPLNSPDDFVADGETPAPPAGDVEGPETEGSPESESFKPTPGPGINI